MHYSTPVVTGGQNTHTLDFITPHKAQNARECASEQFRKSRDAVLISLDVSARGMDYPNVTFILQVGWMASIPMPYLGEASALMQTA